MSISRFATVALAITMAVGTGSFANAVDESAAWGEVPSPNVGNDQNELAGISAVSAADIWAVGRYNSGVVPTATGRKTLALHWNGTTWQIVPTPNPTWPGADFFTLEDVETLAANDAWAVGYTADFASLKSTTLIERWNGSTWQIVKSPNPSRDLPNQLNAVDAVSATDVWAVGATGFPSKSLILHFTGTRWRPVPNACQAPLAGIDVLSPTQIWAVGMSTICRYNGTAWTVVPSPQPPGQFGDTAYQLLDVSAASTDAAWAVGRRIFSTGEHSSSASFIERWNGTSWTPIVNIPGQTLNGVLALAPDDVWAVGTDGIRGIVLHWDGVDWTLVPSPTPGDSGHLVDVTAVGTEHLWAAGTAQNQTLILEAPSGTEGTVVGNTNVAFAVVSWFGPENGSTETNDFGEYSAAGLAAGDYLFTVGNPGCQPGSANVTVIAGTTVEQDLTVSC